MRNFIFYFFISCRRHSFWCNFQFFLVQTKAGDQTDRLQPNAHPKVATRKEVSHLSAVVIRLDFPFLSFLRSMNNGLQPALLHVVLGKNKCQGQFAESQLRPDHCSASVLFLKQLIVSICESWMGDGRCD